MADELDAATSVLARLEVELDAQPPQKGQPQVQEPQEYAADTGTEDISTLGRIIDRLQTELVNTASEERRRWLRYALEATIDIRAHIALQSGISLSD